MLSKRLTLALLALALALSAGCVEREMLITSEPEGATVEVNQTWRGKTPFHLRFKHYGVYDIRLEAPGHYPLHIKEPIKGPGYEQMGADFVSEVLIPARIHDKRELHYKLEKIEKEDDIEGILARSQEMRVATNRVAQMREERDKNRNPKTLPLPTKKAQREKRKNRNQPQEQEPKEKTDTKEPPPAPPAADTPPEMDAP